MYTQEQARMRTQAHTHTEFRDVDASLNSVVFTLDLSSVSPEGREGSRTHSIDQWDLLTGLYKVRQLFRNTDQFPEITVMSLLRSIQFLIRKSSKY